MKTFEELRDRADAIAESHFYCDDECDIPWEPFEFWDRDELWEQKQILADVIYESLIWAVTK